MFVLSLDFAASFSGGGTGSRDVSFLLLSPSSYLSCSSPSSRSVSVVFHSVWALSGPVVDVLLEVASLLSVPHGDKPKSILSGSFSVSRRCTQVIRYMVLLVR